MRIFFGILTILTGLSFNLNAQTVELRGRVIDANTREPVSFASIYTTDRSRGTATDETGVFSFKAFPADTLIFSSVGYEPFTYILAAHEGAPSDNIVIELSQDIKQLKEVTVHAFRDLESFKKAVMEVELPEKRTVQADLPSAEELKKAARLNGQFGGSMKGPFTMMYDAFSHEAKEKKKLEAFNTYKSNQEVINQKYNVDVVQRITNLDKEDAEAFMNYCTFEDNYLLTVTDYDLAVAMLECLKSFKKED